MTSSYMASASTARRKIQELLLEKGEVSDLRQARDQAYWLEKCLRVAVKETFPDMDEYKELLLSLAEKGEPLSLELPNFCWTICPLKKGSRTMRIGNRSISLVQSLEEMDLAFFRRTLPANFTHLQEAFILRRSLELLREKGVAHMVHSVHDCWFLVLSQKMLILETVRQAYQEALDNPLLEKFLQQNGGPTYLRDNPLPRVNSNLFLR